MGKIQISNIHPFTNRKRPADALDTCGASLLADFLLFPQMPVFAFLSIQIPGINFLDNPVAV